MRSSLSARLVIGAVGLVTALVTFSDGHPIRNVFTQRTLGLFDVKDHQCRQSPSAIGASCPAGCIARPLTSPESRSVPTECHSALWMATCGKECAPRGGFARAEGDELVDSRNLIVVMHGEPDKALRETLGAMGVTLTPRFDGLDRYDAVVTSGSITEAKKRLSALPEIVAAEFVPR